MIYSFIIFLNRKEREKNEFYNIKIQHLFYTSLLEVKILVKFSLN